MDEEIIKLKVSIKAMEERLDYLEEYIKHKFIENMDNSNKVCSDIENKSIDDIYKRILSIEQRLQFLEDKPK